MSGTSKLERVDSLLRSLDGLRSFVTEQGPFYQDDDDQLMRIAVLSADATFWHNVLTAFRERLVGEGKTDGL